MAIFAPLLIYVSAIGTLCGSLVLAAAMFLAAPPNASGAIEGKAAPIPAKFVRAADRVAVQPAKPKAETVPTALVTPATASVASPPASALSKGLKQKRAAAPAKTPIARSRPQQPPGTTLGYAAAPDVQPVFFARGQ